MLVQLTDKGVAKLREVLPTYFERLTNFTRALNKEERKTFLHLMEKIQAGNSFE
jgi:DNA-binding MarR family transcriptional regulator